MISPLHIVTLLLLLIIVSAICYSVFYVARTLVRINHHLTRKERRK